MNIALIRSDSVGCVALFDFYAKWKSIIFLPVFFKFG